MSIPGSAWPIPYRETARYYPAAARILPLPPPTRFDWTTFAGEMTEHEQRLFSDPSLQPTVSPWTRKPLQFGAVYRSRLQSSPPSPWSAAAGRESAAGDGRRAGDPGTGGAPQPLRDARGGLLRIHRGEVPVGWSRPMPKSTRMGTTPRTGVVDADCRVHSVSNLYVAAGSVFPSAGHANPTLTIVALALRLAEHLRRG